MAENTTSVIEEDSIKFEDMNKEEDSLYPTQIKGDANNNIEEEYFLPPFPNDSQPLNNNFCFTKDDFLESVTRMNDTTRNRGVCHNVWKNTEDLEGKEVT